MGERTEDNDIQDQDNEADDTATGTILPRVSCGSGRNILHDRGAEGQSSQAQLEEEVEDSVEHLVYVDLILKGLVAKFL